MKRKILIIASAAALSATLAVGAYLLGAKQAAAPSPADATYIESDPAELTAIKTIRARDTLRQADGRMDAIVGLDYARKHGHLIHSHVRAVLPMPAVDSERFDDARIMRAAARRDADAFIEKYSHNGGLIK